MTRLHTVIRQITIAATAEACWPFVSEPRLVAEWFADVRGSLAPGEPYRFDFGDGDYFDGVVLRRDPPLVLELTWRFMGVGTESLIELHLLPRGDRTEVGVVDRGEYSEAGAGELADGWEDFLSRLAECVQTGSRTRYRWSETIGTGAIVALGAGDLRRAIADEAIWRRAFPQASVRLQADGETTEVFVREPGWGALETRARLRAGERSAGSCLSVVHEGWAALPEGVRYDARARYAACWAAALSELEARFGRPGEAAAADARRRAADR